jgi:hypothetical protein
MEEMEEIETANERDQLAGGAGFLGPIRTLYRSKAYLKRLAIAVSLFAMQNGTGINAISELEFSFDSLQDLTVPALPSSQTTTPLLSSSPSVLPEPTPHFSLPVSLV